MTTLLFESIQQISDEKENEIEKLKMEIFMKDDEIKNLKEENVKLRNSNFRLKERLKKKLIDESITD